jgi:hypothetical protein
LSKAAAARLTLAAATYDPTAMTLTLQFDRAVNVDGLDGTKVAVMDGTTQLIELNCTGTVTRLDPKTVRFGLVNFGDYTDPPGVWLNADVGNGIVAADDGAAWAGVSDVGLPFP